MNKNIESLKQKGYQVTINHYRPFYMEVKGKRGGIKLETIHLPRYHVHNPKLKLQTKGGYSSVAVYYPNGALIEETIAVCSNDDVFSYSQGVNECIKKMKQPEIIW